MKYAKNKAPEKCQNLYCRNESAIGRKVCNTCKSRDYINRNRLLMVWHWIKKSAKKRNIFFNLDKTEFKLFLLKHSYIEYSGRGKNNFTIDRIKPELGYTINNLQVITKSNNSKKYHAEEKHPF